MKFWRNRQPERIVEQPRTATAEPLINLVRPAEPLREIDDPVWKERVRREARTCLTATSPNSTAKTRTAGLRIDRHII